MALSEEGRTYSWGNGDNGRLGHNSKRSEALPKEIIALKEKVRAIFAGDAHSACISIKNTLYTWGRGSYGRLGHGFTEDIYRPEQVEELCNIKIEDVFLGSYHTFVLSDDGEIFAWGGCEYGRIGILGKNTGNLILPTLLPKFTKKRILELSAGPYHTLSMTSAGKLYTWGDGKQGKLGIKGATYLEAPTKISFDIKFGKLFGLANASSSKPLGTGPPKQPRVDFEEDFAKDYDIFNIFDEGMKLRAKTNSNKSLKIIQVGICQKQTLFLTN